MNENNASTKKKWDWADKAVRIDHGVRKEAKKRGKHTVKTHYFLLLIVCLIVAFLGVESVMGSSSNNAYKMSHYYASEDYNDGTVVESADGTEQVDEQSQTFSDILVMLAKGDVQGAINKTQSIVSERANRRVTREVLGTQAGIFAGLVNKFEGGSFIIILYKGVNNIVGNSAVAVILLIALALLLYLFIWTFFLNILRVIKRRIFLESRMYDKVPVSHIFYLKNAGKWTRASITMLVEAIYATLWSFTLIGWPIKHYAYWLTPFIVAENPSLNANEAITLSRKMMYGYKWRVFVYELSFVGWVLLSVVTLGLADYFFLEPYQTATDSEIYALIRKNYIDNKLDGYEMLNDKYLFEKADQELLDEKYAGNIATAKYISEHRVILTGAKKFFAENLGIWFGTAKTQKAYEDVELLVVENDKNENIVAGRIYPGRLSPLASDWDSLKKKSKAEKINYNKTYTIWSLLSLFFLFAFVGWGWEVLIHIVKDGLFINRGTMYGPWLPIYGGGAFLILTVLKRFRKNPVLLSVATIILCGCVEYFASYYLEITKGQRWWDYTGYFLNLNGRICAEGLMVFMIAGVAATYVIAPVLDKMIMKIDSKVLLPIIILLLITFFADMRYSGKYPNGGSGVTNYTRYKEAEQNEAEDKIKEEQSKQAAEQSVSSTEPTESSTSLLLTDGGLLL